MKHAQKLAQKRLREKTQNGNGIDRVTPDGSPGVRIAITNEPERYDEHGTEGCGEKGVVHRHGAQ